MKHLRKYNESNINLEDVISYIRECFAEFYDNDFYETEEEEDYEDRFLIMINIPTIDSPYRAKDIKEFIDWSTELNDFLLDIQVAINRVKDKYPVNITVEEDSFQKNLEMGDSRVKTIRYLRIYFIK
jgi:hypothetical protein